MVNESVMTESLIVKGTGITGAFNLTFILDGQITSDFYQ